MNYYQFHMGDYAAHTRGLSLLEDLAYRRLLDLYYLNERPLNGRSTELAREIGMRDNADEVAYILGKFFTENEDGEWVNSRAQSEIDAYKTKAEQQSRAGKASAEARKSKTYEPKATPVERPLNDRSTNQEPRTKNHKPIEERRRATRLPDDWRPSLELSEWARVERPDLDTSKTIASFGDYWRGKAGKDGAKLDWDATFRNWVRNERSTPVQRPFNASGMTAAEEAQREADRRNARRPGPDRGLENLSKSLAAAVPMPPEVRERLAKAQGAAA